MFDGGTYGPTEDDETWLLRAVQVEGRPHELVARALVNGFCWARARRSSRASLMSWVRSYAQPVNPRWYLSGDLFAKHCAGLVGEVLESEKRRAYARETQHARCALFASHVVGAVRLSLSTHFRSDITDYAAQHIDATRKGYQARSLPKPGENRLWTRAPGWPGYDVKLAPLSVA